MIRKQVNGVRYEISTRAYSETAAHAQLKLFQANPGAYDPNGEQKEDALYLDAELVRDFLAYSKAKQNSGKWIGEQKRTLEWWTGKLHGVNLRGASLRDRILPALKETTNKHARTALKALYTWLRRERHLITLAEDPVAGGMLQCVQASKIQKKKNKAVPREERGACHQPSRGTWKDALVIQSETGWHVTEIAPLRQDGEIEPASQSQKDQGVHLLTGERIAGVIIVQHKAGTSIGRRDAENVGGCAAPSRAGRILRRVVHARGRIGLQGGGAQEGIWSGQMRHSVTTWLVEAGADMGSVATFLGHKSPSTTRSFTLPSPRPSPRGSLRCPNRRSQRSKKLLPGETSAAQPSRWAALLFWRYSAAFSFHAVSAFAFCAAGSLKCSSQKNANRGPFDRFLQPG